ncbi:MAG: pilus assembly protein [Planctomycetaceae bacterium]
MQRCFSKPVISNSVRGRRRANTHRRGTLTVEFALVSGIILTLFFAGLEMTSLNLMRHSAGNATYEAARKGIVPGATAAEVEAEARRLLDLIGASNSVNVTVQDDGNRVTVSVSIPVDQNSWGLSRFSSGMTIAKSCTLSRSL